MGRFVVDADYLVRRVRETCAAPPPGVVPWRALELESLLEQAERVAGGHDAFYLAFMEGVHDLCRDECESGIFQKFSWQALTAEARVVADSNNRDHLTHVSQVFLLGWLLLNGTRRFACASPAWQPYGLTLSRDERCDFLNRGWALASLLHDCAYSVETAGATRRHDLLVKGLYRDLYEPSQPGRAVIRVMRDKGERLWRRRGEYISVGAADQVEGIQRTLATQLEKTDHALVTALALFDEIASIPSAVNEPSLADILKAASLAIASHNFQYSVAKHDLPWFRLDFWEEPLAALLHLCDELQSWSRERVDEALSRLRTDRAPWASTEITELRVDDAQGIGVDLRLVRHLYPSDRARRRWFVLEEEKINAATARRLRKLFQQRTAPPEFQLHLRVRSTVEDLPCSNELTVAWPKPEAGIAGELDRRWRLSSSALAGLAPATVRAAGATFTLRHDGTVDLDRAGLDGSGPVRLVLVGPGGLGKSTFLQALARSAPHNVARTLYVEELPRHAADLGEELERMHAAHPDGDLLVLVDHLDRLDEAPLGPFWLEQLAELPGSSWLHVIAACRPDEYRASISMALRERFVEARLEGSPAPFVGGAVNRRGNALAAGIESKLGNVSDDLLLRLGEIALGWGQRRLGPLDVPEDLASLRYLSLGEPKLLVPAASGETRFVHDTVQDFCAAYALARRFEVAERRRASAAGTDGDREPRALARQLVDLPADVLRFLIEIVSTVPDRESASRRFSRDRRRDAGLGLGRGLLLEPRVVFWLPIRERLGRLEDAVEAYRVRFADDPSAAAAASLLAGLRLHQFVHFRNFGDPTRRTQILEDALSSLDYLANAAKQLDAVPIGGEAAILWNICIADHFLTHLARLCHIGSVKNDVLTAARRAIADMPIERAPAVGTLAWLRASIARYCDAPSFECGMAEFERIDADIDGAFTGEGDRTWGPPWLAVRRVHLAGHLAGTWGLSPWLAGPDTRPDAERVTRALEWNQRARVRLTRIARAMVGRRWPDTVETMATLAQVRADTAYRSSVEFKLRALTWRPGLAPDAAGRITLDLLDAHGRQEVDWRVTRNSLSPGERLSNLFHASLPLQALGTVLHHLAMRVAPPNKSEVENALASAAKDLLEEYRARGESHPRVPAESDTPEGFYADIENGVGSVCDMVADLCRALV